MDPHTKKTLGLFIIISLIIFLICLIVALVFFVTHTNNSLFSTSNNENENNPSFFSPDNTYYEGDGESNKRKSYPTPPSLPND